LRPEAGYEQFGIRRSLRWISCAIFRRMRMRRGAAYLAKLHGWVGLDGVYDFIGFPQRGIGVTLVLIMRWIRQPRRSFRRAAARCEALIPLCAATGTKTMNC